MIPEAETVSRVEEVIACAKSDPRRAVYFLVPHSGYEEMIRRLLSDPIPTNIVFIPRQNWLEELKPLQCEKVFTAAGCAKDMDQKTLDALAKAMMG